MRFRTYKKRWGAQSWKRTQLFVPYRQREAGFRAVRHFHLATFSVRFVLTFFTLLALVSYCPGAEGGSAGNADIAKAVKNAVGSSILPGQLSDILRARSRGQQAEQVEQQAEQPTEQPEEPETDTVQGQKERREEEEELSAIELLLSGQIPSVVSRNLTQFGYNVFRGSVSTFAPITNVPVGPDYVVGPGDSFRITLWGRVNEQYNVTLNRNGEIVLPEVGVLNVSGMTLERLEDYLQDQFSRKHADFKMAVTMSRLRAIVVYVVGEAMTPGSYTLSSLSTVMNALFAAGGPSKNGTLRNIQLLRNRKERVTIDFYDFLLGGDKSGDVRLQNGDTIFIPLIGPVVGVAGNVKRPAIYEMAEPMTLAEVLDLAGGVTYAGWLQHVQVERIDNHKRRIVADFDISGEADVSKEKQAAYTVTRDGDVVKVFPVSSLEQNIVYLEGHVVRPDKYELIPGMRLSDILKSYGQLQSQPNVGYGEIERLVEPDFHPITIPFNLGKLLEGDESEDLELARFDTIRIFRWDERIKRSVSISGETFRPGEYRLVQDMKVSDLVDAGGGLMKNAYLKSAEITRRHISQSGMQTEKIDVDLEKALAGVAEHNIALQDYDHLVVRPIPELEFDRTATISGEVMFPGTYPIRRGETLSSLIERAGGFTERAYLKAAVFTRESVKAVQQEKRDALIQKMEEDILTRTERRISGSGTLSKGIASAQEPLIAAQRELLAKLRAAEARGRVVVRVSELDEFRGSNYDLELEPSDELVIPEKPGVINVVGEVYNPVALLHEDNKTVAYYLSKVGGPTKEADKKHLSIIRADGSIASMSQKKLRKVTWDSENNHWFFGSFMNVKLDPGDTIMVPTKLDKYAWIQNTKDITQILYQLALPVGVLLGL